MKFTKRKMTGGKLALLVATLFMVFVALPVVAFGNTMIHNSTTLGSTKWGVGGWGVVGGKYGEFKCGTCHERNSGNIKRVKKDFVAPNSPADQFPTEADPAIRVNFMDIRDGSSDFGDDTNAGRVADVGVDTKSDKVCEACHSLTKFHNYNSTLNAGNGGDLDHYNKADCMICHPHNQGFKPLDCSACHGYPPTTTDNDGSTTTGLSHNPSITGSTTAGAHATHAALTGITCEDCHNNYVMPQLSSASGLTTQGDISISFSNFGSTTGSYSGQTGVSYNNVEGTGSVTCSTVYCHSTGQSADGTSATPSSYSAPVWTGAVACGTCHNGTDPGTGSHSVHITDGADCGSCHLDAVSGTTVPTGVHVNGSIDVYNSATGDLGYTAGGVRGNGYGTCNTASCHDQGRGGLATTPTWGTPTNDCSECHASAPATGGHTIHLAASIAGTAIACADCHDAATDPSTETAPASGHRDTNIDVTVGSYPADKAKDTAFATCSTASCHQTGQSTNDYTVTNLWDFDAASCTQCHEASPTTGSHTKHIATTSDCATCHTNAVINSSYNDAAHGDVNVDVAVGSYTANKAYGAAQESCAAISCHSDGLTAATGTSPVWGTASGCSACHETTMTTGSHTAHLTDGATCNNCHLDAVEGTTAPTGIHANGNVDVYNSASLDLGYTATNGYTSATWTTCNAASCHDQGRGGLATSPAWGTATTDCTECHAGAAIATGSHGAHISGGAACLDCHDAATNPATETAPASGHRDSNIDTQLVHGYTQDKAKDSAFETCATAVCHNDGRNSGLTGTWGTTLNNCSECHATAPATGSHTTHLGLYACATCHTGATQGTTAGAGHRDGNITTAASTGLGAKLIGTAFTSCGTNNCHGSGSPVWGTDLSVNDQCTQCHGELVVGPATDAQKAPGGAGVDTNGDSIDTDAQVGAHQVHLNPTISKAVACTACHTVPTAITDAGHIDSALPAELTFSGLALGGLDGQSAVAPAGCATTYCHDGAAFKNGGTWDNGSLSPTWNDPTFVTGFAADCDNCHGYPPAGGHVANSDCSVCHDVLNADDLTFTAAGKLTHVDGFVQASGGDNCIDCHTTLTGAHDAHTDEALILGTAALSVEGYGGLANWYGENYVSGKPNFGCGLCHPKAATDHIGGTPTVNLTWNDTGSAGSLKAENGDSAGYAGAGGACDQIYCHSDGKATAARVYGWQTSPNWNGGTVSGNCTDCHANGPASGTHANHIVGIHYETLYDGASGLMVASGTTGSGAAHGDAATADSISCQTCHNATVAVEVNDQNAVCNSCHDGGVTAPVGNVAISTLGSTHVNGTADVVFADLSIFKSRAQVRDDVTTVAELNNNWTRTNSYKAANSFDQAKVATPSYAGGSCSNVSCHNGINTPTWSTGFNGDCRACHTTLP